MEKNFEQVELSDAELATLDKWREDRKIETRSEAIRQLIKGGIHATEGRRPLT